MEQLPKRFKIEANVDHLPEELEVQKEQGPQGPQFVCYLDGRHITTLRQDDYGSWEQVTGDLDPVSVHSVSQAIEETD
ncbi:hypothetical protein C7T94_19000 [Pedobacter yulinensis]|uniref:Uncharacterized protein n=1 Tax=Pedobacter yulinensis TaxID=2126353 RepID=A0A2T3HGQ4_9SPHI|nr:hypothetical protein [Pedobacter yulinensis]PST81561.1 hypothetical protein C7T94_19000 [Pedobacter yulinensis]